MIDPKAKASFEPAMFPRRLNLGCGFDRREGFLNIDMQPFHKPDLVSDVTRLDMLPSSYYEYALARDVLEHIPRPRCQNTLREWNRVLVMDGTLELEIPNVLGLAELLRGEEYQSFEQQMHLLQCLFGTQSYDGDFHFNGFTELTLRHMLQLAGFECVELRARDVWLFVVEARKVRHVEREAILDLADDGEFLEMAYRTRLGRDPDPEGLSFWQSRLREGAERESVLARLEAAAAAETPASVDFAPPPAQADADADA